MNPLGLTQVASLVTLLAAEPIQAVYTSDLLRARQTAELIATAHGVPVYCRPALREIHFGDWETLNWAQIEVKNPSFAAKWVAEFPHLPAPNGESITLFRARILTELHALSTLIFPDQTAAVITHAGPLRILLEEFGHYAPQHAWERTREYTCTIRATHTSTGTFTISS